MEIRPIKADEADGFLMLLVDAFGIDAARARQAFFSDPTFDLKRKWAAFQGSEIVSILTTTPLTFGWGRAIGIAGVATAIQHRGKGYGEQLLESVLNQAHKDGEGSALLFAHRTVLYERVGFNVVDEVVTAPIVVTEGHLPRQPLSTQTVMELYQNWSAKSQSRLVRDTRRWRYWNWIHRPCEPVGTGYICHESGVCREAILEPGLESWPVALGVKWIGLASMTKLVGVPLASNPDVQMLLMGRQLGGPVEMFMTDQF